MSATLPILLIDGATGSELDRRGVDTALPLWSARALLEAPEILLQIHRDYLEAGAGAITTNTFRTHDRTLRRAGLNNRATELTRRAVEIGRRACDDVNPKALVLGSVAPLEDCYEPALAPPEAECKAEHGRMIDTLLAAGVDLLLLETMNNVAEARAAIHIARSRAPGRWMVSFCTQVEAKRGTPGAMLSGESIADLAGELAGAYFVGVNCAPAPDLARQVRFLRDLLPDSVRISAYANVGTPDSQRGWINTDAINPDRYAEYAREWIEAGASVIGGCCGTTPDTIRAIKETIAGL